MSRFLTVFLLVSTLGTSCSPLIPSPTSTPIYTDTPNPAEPLLPTMTLTPTITVKKFAASIWNPTGTPAKEWKNIPIMEKALTGDISVDSWGRNCGYTFIISASVGEIEQYYDSELLKLGLYQSSWGWQENRADYRSKDGRILFIAIFSEDRENLVLLTDCIEF